MRNFIISLVICFGSVSFCNAQVQHFFKVGASSEFTHFKGNSSANYQFADSRFPRPIIGYEIGLPSKKPNLKWIASIDLFTMQAGWTTKNPDFVYRNMSVGYLGGQLMVGSEYKLKTKTEKVNKNYFSLMGGIAFPFILQNDTYRVESGTTNSSGQLVYVENVDVKTKQYYPAFNLGLRYHIRNRIGREVLILELKYNNSFGNYANSTINYSINNVQMAESVNVRAKQLSVSLIVPIGKWRKRTS